MLGEWVKPSEVIGVGTINQLQRAIWSGVRYTTNEGLGTKGLTINSLDAALACPIVPSIGGHILGNSTPMGEGNPQVPVLTADLVSGIAFSLQQNLMPISGFAQWYPFGTGSYYQQRDEASLFRFELHVSEE